MTNSTSENHYEVLKADENATQEEIKAAYKKQVKELHPDQFEKSKEWVKLEAIERSKRANAAYDVLKDPRTRAGYDLELRRKRESTGHDATREQERRQQARWEEERRTEQAEQRRREREERRRYEREEQERQERREREEQRRRDAEARQRAEEGWGAWEEEAGERAGDGNATGSEEGAEGRRDEWEETEEQDESGHEQPHPPVQDGPGSVLELAARTAERIPKAVHLVCGSMLSGWGWILATLAIGPGISSVGVLLVLACLGSIPVAAWVLWVKGLSNLSKPSMVLVALGGGIPMLLITSILPGVRPLLLLGSLVWAVVMLTAAAGRRRGVRV